LAANVGDNFSLLKAAGGTILDAHFQGVKGLQWCPGAIGHMIREEYVRQVSFLDSPESSFSILEI
jgi:hypothetical protein